MRCSVFQYPCDNFPHMGVIHRRLLVFVLAIVARPKTTLLISGLTVVACALLAATRLSISSDQNKLFSPNVKFFRDYLDFVDQFPENEAIYIVVRAAVPKHPPPVQRWTQIADAITAKLAAMPKYVKSVDSKIPTEKLGAQGILFDTPDKVKQSIAQARFFIPTIIGIAEKPNLLTSKLGDTPIERFFGAYDYLPASETAPLMGAVADSLRNTLAPQTPFSGTPGEGGGGGERGLSQATQPAPTLTLPNSTALIAGRSTGGGDVILPDLEALDAEDPSRLGYYYVPNEEDRSQHQLLVRVYQQPNFTSLTAISEEVEAIRTAAREAAAPFQDFTVGTTGRPALEADEMRTTDRDSNNAEVVALIVVFLGLVAMLRSIWLALAAEIALVVGISWTFAWATVSIGELNLLSIVFLIALIGIGMDYLIQILVRYRREARRYVRADAVWMRVFSHVSAPINTACFGAAGAFLVSCFTNFRGAAELGVIAGGGLLLCLLAGYTVLPALLVLFPPKLSLVDVSERYHAQQTQPNLLRRAIGPGLWILAVLIGIPFAMRTKFDPGLIDLQAPKLESVQLVRSLQTWYSVELSKDVDVLRRVRSAVETSPHVKSTESILDATDNQAWLNKPENQLPAIAWADPEDVKPGDLKRISDHCRALATHFSSFEQVAQSLREVGASIDAAKDPSAVAARLSAWQRAFVGELHTMLDKLHPPPLDVAALPIELRGHYVSDSGLYALYIYPKGDLWNHKNLANFVYDVEGRVISVPGAPRVTGIASNVYHSTDGIRRSFFKATLYALLLIAFLVFIDLRKLDQTIMAMSVLALGLPMLVALMGILHIDWNFANFFGLPILIGAGHEYGVFLVHRYRETLAHPRRVWRGWDASDRALMLCAFVTSSSFGFFWALGHHVGLRSLGLVMAMGTACIYLASVCVLQPVLKWRLSRQLASVIPSPGTPGEG